MSFSAENNFPKVFAVWCNYWFLESSLFPQDLCHFCFKGAVLARIMN